MSTTVEHCASVGTAEMNRLLRALLAPFSMTPAALFAPSSTGDNCMLVYLGKCGFSTDYPPDLEIFSGFPGLVALRYSSIFV